VTVKVFRYNPEIRKESWYDTFVVPLPADGSCTVLDALDYIHLHLDGSLSYYRHSTCNQGICGRCAAKVDGKPALMCECRIRKNEICVEPANNKYVKDLVVL
jgi:succinate dehydrogenase / fumarate reductase iron-sulfur subunit